MGISGIITATGKVSLGSKKFPFPLFFTIHFYLFLFFTIHFYLFTFFVPPLQTRTRHGASLLASVSSLVGIGLTQFSCSTNHVVFTDNGWQTILFTKSFCHITFFRNFAPTPIAYNGHEGQKLTGKGRLTNVIFGRRISQVLSLRRYATETSALGVLYAVLNLNNINISWRGLSRVAYPEARQCESPTAG